MNQKELIQSIADKSGLSFKDAEKAFTAFRLSVETTLKQGGSVNLVGFGTFSVKERAARIGRNPKTGEELQIAASKVPTFKAGKAFKESVN
ncbi:MULTISPECIES: HU family DNA-binding protein [unclassified Acinetobacter]|uniref:HU family DNA-binding protein n=1 Tax=unclassified Acinetobacter TaxID=196816 RepID=UPI0019090E47|nr:MULTISPECIES: HU family DNA-binding protein [unclassified Acinetobacter]MBK0062410.1 HU family DNA-binding protein [Acinetobacter sp. S55]MBK0066214.1 HU family DNA-binding protein [Acinetobacter sp. S54]